MGNVFYFGWEVRLIEWLQQYMGSLGVMLAVFFTMMGEEMVMVGIMAFLYFCFDKAVGESIGISLTASLIWNPMVKNVVVRRRPYFDHSSIRCLKAVDAEADLFSIEGQGFSFPSGHSENAMILFGGIAGRVEKKAVYAVMGCLIFLVGLSRCALGVHYPTDVLAGFLFGFLTLLITGFMEKKIRDRRLLYLILILTGIPGLFYCRTTDFFTGYGIMIGFFLATLFEHRYVNFKVTRRPVRAAVRLAGAMGCFLLMNQLLKLPFSKSFLESTSTAAYFVRLFRYMAVTFVTIGVFPMCFKYGDRLEERRKK